MPKSNSWQYDMAFLEHRGCRTGTYESPQQWRGLLRGNLAFEKKALVAIPVGYKAREAISSLIDSMGHRAFDYVLFAYDEYPWEVERLADKPGVTLLRTRGGRKWALYYNHLNNRTHLEKYSHLFLWDDDLQPVLGYFDGELLLHFLQQLKIEIAQPMIRRNHHGSYGFEGTDFKMLSGGGRDGAFLREVQIVEIMAPCYSVRVWLECILPRMIDGGGEGGGWGIDIYLQNTGSCVPEKLFSIALPLDHIDGKALEKNNTASRQELNQYGHLARQYQWQTRPHLISCQFNHSTVFVDRDCSVQKAFEESTPFVKQKSAEFPCKRV